MDAMHNARNKIARVLDILEALLSSPPPLALWPEWMRRATASLAQFENLSRDLRGEALGKLLVVPASRGLAALGGNHQLVSDVLLRTKLPPEVEKGVEALTSVEIKERRNADGASSSLILAQMLQDAADSLKSASKHVMDTPLTDNEALIRVVKNQYTAVQY